MTHTYGSRNVSRRIAEHSAHARITKPPISPSPLAKPLVGNTQTRHAEQILEEQQVADQTSAVSSQRAASTASTISTKTGGKLHIQADKSPPSKKHARSRDKFTATANLHLAATPPSRFTPNQINVMRLSNRIHGHRSAFKISTKRRSHQRLRNPPPPPPPPRRSPSPPPPPPSDHGSGSSSSSGHLVSTFVATSVCLRGAASGSSCGREWISETDTMRVFVGELKMTPPG